MLHTFLTADQKLIIGISIPSTETGGFKWQQLHQVLAVTSCHESNLPSKCFFPQVSFVKMPSIYILASIQKGVARGQSEQQISPLTNISKTPPQFCNPIVLIETLEPPPIAYD